MRLLLALCAPAADKARTAAAASRPIDGATFLALATRHRVGALAWRGLAAAGITAPAGTAPALARIARVTAARGLVLAAETARLDAALDAAGIATVALKGAPLAMLVYGNVTIKHARDIDLLVAHTNLHRAAAVLERAGYRRWGGGAVVPLATRHRFAKDSGWRHPATGIVVELHTNLTDHPRHLLPGLDTNTNCQRISLGPGLAVRTFAPEPLFAYLCVHGALSGWRRLKWLADLAWLIHNADADEIVRLHAAAGDLGAGRAATQAIVLAASLLGTALPVPVSSALAEDLSTRLLVRGARWLLSRERESGTLPLHVMTALLRPGRGWRYALLHRYLRADPEGPPWLPFPLARALRRTR